MPDFANAYAGKTVTITGASGYLASALVDALGREPARIVCVSRRAQPLKPGLEVFQTDLRTAESWGEIISWSDTVFHLSGNTSVYAANENPADSLSSTVLPIALLEVASKASGRRPRIVLASTVTQYGLGGSFPIGEGASMRPVNNYDLHKLFAEQQLLLATERGYVNGVSLRLANVFGPSSATSSAADRGVLNKVIRMALKGDTLKVYGTGSYVRDYVYVADVARAFLAAGMNESMTGRAFNVASGKGTTIREAFEMVASRVEKITGNRILLLSTPWPADSDKTEFRNFEGDYSSIAKASGWLPLISLENGIDRTIHGFLEESGK